MVDAIIYLPTLALTVAIVLAVIATLRDRVQVENARHHLRQLEQLAINVAFGAEGRTLSAGSRPSRVARAPN